MTVCYRHYGHIKATASYDHMCVCACVCVCGFQSVFVAAAGALALTLALAFALPYQFRCVFRCEFAFRRGLFQQFHFEALNQ